MPRKVFVAGEILTAADVNTNLMDQSVMVFDDAAARATAIPTPVEGMLTYLEDVGGAQGLEVFDGSDFVPVAIEPDPPAILQVVQGTLTTPFSAAVGEGGSVAITGLTATITPSSTSSKILVSAHVTAGPDANSVQGYFYTLTRAGSAIFVGDAAGSRQQRTSAHSATAPLGQESASMTFLDTPASTSALTYGLAVSHTEASSTTLLINRNSQDADNARTARTTSAIILMEVAG